MRKILHTLRIAIKGSEKEFTSGSINRAILLLSIPMILEMMMESLFAVVDAFFVTKIGVNAIATVGMTESVVTLIYATAIGLSMAATAMVARRIGEQKKEEAAVVAVQVLIIAFIASAILGILGFCFAKDILRLMGGSPELVEEGYQYTRILFAGNISIMLLFLLNGIYRGAGDASIAMRSLWIANSCNIILDPCLIFGWGPFPEMGLTGAAIATTTGRGIGVLYQLYILFYGNNILQIRRRHFRFKWPIIQRLLRISVGGISQHLIASSSWIFMMRIVSAFGSEAVAGYTIAIRIIIFTILPSWGMANAAATLVGQNLGAGHPKRAERSVWRTANFNMVFLILVALVFYIWAPELVTIFEASNPTVINEGTRSLRIISIGYLFFAHGMIISQAFNGAGDTRTPTWINFISFWLIQIPLAYLLAFYFSYGSAGVYWAIAMSEAILALLAILIFRQGRWKMTQV
ncbi:MAG: MATE family efflux transporter [Bacteroidota bacterium]